MDDDDIVIIENAGPSRPKVPIDPKPVPSGSKRNATCTPELDDSKVSFSLFILKPDFLEN